MIDLAKVRKVKKKGLSRDVWMSKQEVWWFHLFLDNLTKLCLCKQVSMSDIWKERRKEEQLPCVFSEPTFLSAFPRRDSM